MEAVIMQVNKLFLQPSNIFRFVNLCQKRISDPQLSFQIYVEKVAIELRH